nr:MAG TPA: Photosystem II protein D1 1 II, Time resolved, Free [Caudoviricetes sp.]
MEVNYTAVISCGVYVYIIGIFLMVIPISS